MNITPEELRRLQKILSNEKGSLSQTHKKNTEANAEDLRSQLEGDAALWRLWQPCVPSSRRLEKTGTWTTQKETFSMQMGAPPSRSSTEPSTTNNACGECCMTLGKVSTMLL